MDGWHFHNGNDAQQTRDELKNQIFTKLGLPLLRISTTDTVNQETIGTRHSPNGKYKVTIFVFELRKLRTLSKLCE